MSNASHADALRIGPDNPGIALDSIVIQSSLSATSDSPATPSINGEGSNSLNQVIARGDLALRAIRYRKRAAEFEAAAMELEQAILLAKNGQPQVLQRLLDGQAEKPERDIDLPIDQQSANQLIPNVGRTFPEPPLNSTPVESDVDPTTYEGIPDSQNALLTETTVGEQPSAANTRQNDAPKGDSSSIKPAASVSKTTENADGLLGDSKSTKPETRTTNAKPAKKRLLNSKPSPSSSVKSSKKTANTKTPSEAITRKRLSSWGISTVVHLCVVMALAVVTIKGMDPPKASSIMAGTVDSNEVSMVPDELNEAMSTEFDIEAVDTEQELPQEPSLNVEHGNLQMASSAFEMEAGVGPATESGGSISEQVGRVEEMTSGSIVKKTGASFFGTEAVGNTFVYIVDSSGSMRRNGAFDTAKLELARSLYTMKPTQRFYIYFFSEKIDRLTVRGEEPEKFPIHATPENIELAIRWMQTIQIRGGKGPNDVLGEAISLRPDGVFLMFDGDTKMDVAKHLRKINRTNDFISGEIPLVPIHTIGFNSEEFSDSLRKIASENLGTYRFVTPPPSQNPRRKM